MFYSWAPVFPYSLQTSVPLYVFFFLTSIGNTFYSRGTCSNDGHLSSPQTLALRCFFGHLSDCTLFLFLFFGSVASRRRALTANVELCRAAPDISIRCTPGAFDLLAFLARFFFSRAVPVEIFEVICASSRY